MTNLFKKSNKTANNSILTIHAYKYYDQWVFDDERVGLDKEAFVAGADTLLDELTGNGNTATVVFSANKFPTADVELKLLRTDSIGSTYWCDLFQHEVWLCPALFLYYPKAPQTIFFKATISRK
jgi:hypothetical protein